MESKADRSLDELLALDKANLEARIERLESEIEERKRLSDETLTTLANERLRLNDTIWKMRYLSHFDTAFTGKTTLMAQRQQIERLSAEEKIARFKDLSQLEYNRQRARERLEQERKLRELL